MTDSTARLALPMILPGQAQKEMFHNEALALLDIASQASVTAAGVNQPPIDPEPGDCWIVGANPVGDWADRAGAIAGWTDGGWRFVAPVSGMRVWDDDVQRDLRYGAGGWAPATTAEPAPPIAMPDGGETVDGEARAAIGAILAALRQHELIGSP